MGRPSNREERRRQIVDGLLVAMGEAGYEGATVAAIGRAAGLAPGLVHYHFAHKQAILLALVDALAAQIDARYASRSGAPDPWGRLDALIDAHLALGVDADPRAVAAWVAIGTEALRQPEVQQAYEQVVRDQLERLRLTVRAVLVEQDKPTRNARSIAAAIMSTIEGAYRLAVTAPGVLPKGFAAPALKAMVRGAVERA
jgi:TetR/AcrR family transcriptional regulator, transcriptional repressor of bet genes